MSYDLILCGTGFASSFFLHGYLARWPKARVLVLERGEAGDYRHAVATRTPLTLPTEGSFDREGLQDKDWLFTLALGGGSNCWWGQTPRMWPEDFELQSQYGQGHDWPLSYAELEPYYEAAEALIQVAGPRDAPYPRRGPCPQPAHPLSSFDHAMQRVVGPEMWAACPTARSSRGTAARAKCCASGVCGLCPVDAKFRVMNEMAGLYTHHSVTLGLGAEVSAVRVEGGRATGVIYRQNEQEREATAPLVFLGLNALFNPHVLLASGDTHPLTGKRLHEQVSQKLYVDLAELQNFDGGTHITGLGYMYYGGAARARRASCLIEHVNAPPMLRTENGKWRKRAVFKIVAENLPEDRNQVTQNGDRPRATFEGHTAYATTAIEEVREDFLSLLDTVTGIEAVRIEPGFGQSEGHIQGTHVMATTVARGVTNDRLAHHQISGLLLGGSGGFPSGPPANPSLTIAALSLRAAALL